MKISNRTKDIITLSIIVVGLFILFVYGIVAFISAICATNEVNAAIINEYNSREVIIRAETEQDRIHNRKWRKQWCDYYEVSEDKLEDILVDCGKY